MGELQPAISVVVPLFNEEENLGLMHERLVTALEPIGQPFEILFVNDGSRDATSAIGRQLCEQDRRVTLIDFRRNYGQTPAMVAGIRHARGAVIITMDGDLQNDPRDIPAFLEKIGEGYDIVVGWRVNRQDKLVSRKIPSKVANWLIGKVTGVPIKDNGCSLKAYRAEVIKGIPLYSEMHRFIPAMASMAGTRVHEIPVRHHARQFGQSKYGLSRIYKVFFDLIAIKTLLTSLRQPLLYYLMLAALPLFLGVVLAIVGVIQEGYMLAASGFLYITLAVSLTFWGVLADMLYRTGAESTQRLASLTQRVYEAQNANRRH